MQPISSDIRRRGVVVRASSDARLRASSAITTFFAVACSMVVNEAMSLVQDGVLGAEELEAISPTPFGLPGRRSVRPRVADVPEVDVVKAFFDAFWIVRGGATASTAQPHETLEGFLVPSVLALFSSIFHAVRVQSNGALAAVNARVFGRALNVGACLPVGTQVLDQQFVGIVDNDGAVGAKKQRKVLTGGRFVSTEDELGACASKLFDMPRGIFKDEVRDILESEEMADRDKTKELSQMLKRCIHEHVQRVRGPRAQLRTEPRAARVARDPGANASTSQPRAIVPRKNTGEVIDDETVSVEMMREYLRSNGRLREEDVADFMTCHCLRTPTFLNALVKQANALYESHPEWHLTAEERRSMLQRERREGVIETQMDAARADAMLDHDDTEMEDSDDDINHQSTERPQSVNARTTKDVSGRQRAVLEDIINEYRAGGGSD